ncbi:hypothetical protein BCF44_107233 [Kutzneria buriramensis]|uniref:Uncharacterized protein n=1 Tax=Kutzneria buriramensis TaxID=1045776 RepID=A0A3E0HIB8_9PSEU|nr:hypothetical protein BCF44_107233 [Kutzneria buriramensis]
MVRSGRAWLGRWAVELSLHQVSVLFATLLSVWLKCFPPRRVRLLVLAERGVWGGARGPRGRLRKRCCPTG